MVKYKKMLLVKYKNQQQKNNANRLFSSIYITEKMLLFFSVIFTQLNNLSINNIFPFTFFLLHFLNSIVSCLVFIFLKRITARLDPHYILPFFFEFNCLLSCFYFSQEDNSQTGSSLHPSFLF